MNKLPVLLTVAAILAAGPAVAVSAEAYADLGINDELAARGENVRLAYAEFVAAGDSGFEGMKLVFFKDTGNKQVDAHWVPGDPRGQGTTDVLYLTDTVDGAANCGDGCTIDSTLTTAVIEYGMAEWDSINCSSLPIVNAGAWAVDLGYVQSLLGYGGAPFFFPGVITHAGWLPGDFFDALRPNGSSQILGVTFTFEWLTFDADGNLVPTDIDGNGKGDVAFREIYMNNNFAWEIGNDKGLGVYDIGAVMIHEQGHALSQAHFGEISLNPRGKVIVSPKRGDNLMLAAIGSNQEYEGFHGTDTGGHCSIWATWPLK